MVPEAQITTAPVNNCDFYIGAKGDFKSFQLHSINQKNLTDEFIKIHFVFQSGDILVSLW
jgi:hypothetical protein